MPGMITMELPSDPKVVEAFGKVAIRHAQLDRLLQMMVKTLAGTTIDEALLATRRMGSRELRDLIRKLAKQRLGDGIPMVKLRAILQEVENVTEERNDVLHSPIALTEEGEWVATGKDAQLKKSPTTAELESLAKRINEVGMRMTYARLEGWLFEALIDAEKMTGRK
jgi:hypothetical protein